MPVKLRELLTRRESQSTQEESIHHQIRLVRELLDLNLKEEKEIPAPFIQLMTTLISLDSKSPSPRREATPAKKENFSQELTRLEKMLSDALKKNPAIDQQNTEVLLKQIKECQPLIKVKGMSRRTFLIHLLLSGAHVAASFTEPYAQLVDKLFDAAEGLNGRVSRDFEEETKAIRERWGIEIYNGESMDLFPGYQAEKLSKEEFRTMIDMVRSELIKYPDNMLSSLGLQKIRLVKNLTYADKPQQSYSASDNGEVIVSFADHDPHILDSILHSVIFRFLEETASPRYKNWMNDQWLGNPSKVHEKSPLPPKEHRALLAGVLMNKDEHRKYLENVEQKKENGEMSEARYLEYFYFQMYDFYEDFSGERIDYRFWNDLLSGYVDDTYFLGWMMRNRPYGYRQA